MSRHFPRWPPHSRGLTESLEEDIGWGPDSLTVPPGLGFAHKPQEERARSYPEWPQTDSERAQPYSETQSSQTSDQTGWWPQNHQRDADRHRRKESSQITSNFTENRFDNPRRPKPSVPRKQKSFDRQYRPSGYENRIRQSNRRDLDFEHRSMTQGNVFRLRPLREVIAELDWVRPRQRPTFELPAQNLARWEEIEPDNNPWQVDAPKRKTLVKNRFLTEGYWTSSETDEGDIDSVGAHDREHEVY